MQLACTELHTKPRGRDISKWTYTINTDKFHNVTGKKTVIHLSTELRLLWLAIQGLITRLQSAKDHICYLLNQPIFVHPITYHSIRVTTEISRWFIPVQDFFFKNTWILSYWIVTEKRLYAWMILLVIRSNYLVNCYTYNNLKNGHLEKKFSKVLANSNVKKCKISFVINLYF